VIRHFFTAQFLGFLAVGGFAALMHWLARLALNTWMPFSWAVALAYGVGMLVAFLLNSFFIFPRSVRPRSAQARDFVLTNLAFAPLVWAVAIQANASLQHLGMHSHSKELAHALAVSIPPFATFLIYKFVVFKGNVHGQQ
jgi:putative flippase GtrA